jgi:hypothetical protein
MMMKKFKTLFFALALVFGLSPFMPIFANAKNITNADTSVDYIQVAAFSDKANVGGRYYLPQAVAMTFEGGTHTPSGDTVDVVVKNPINQTVTIKQDNGDDYVEVEYVGRYSVTFSVGDVEQTLYFNAVEGVYSFEFEANTPYIIPSVMNINYTGKVVLPNPNVLDEEGNKVESPNVEVRVLKPNTSTPLTSEQLVLNAENHYEFSVDTAGTWTIEYLYKSADNRVLHSTTKTISANTTYNNTYALTYVYDKSVPTTAITGVETVLPGVIAKDPSGKQVEVYVSVSAEKVVYNSQNGSVESKTDVTASTIDGFKFTPQQDGDYLITYLVKDFFGNTASSSTFAINDVRDTQAPVVKIVNPYDTVPTDDFDASYNIPAKAAVKNFILPAIWAEDNVDKTLDKLTLTRKIVRTNGDVVYEGTTSPNKALVFNHDETQYTINPAKEEVVELAEGVSFETGTYNITYVAKDSAGRISTTVTYRVVLETNYVDDVAPVIEWSKTEALPLIAREGDTISFASPTATDKDSQGKEGDTRILIGVKYFFFNGQEPAEEDWTALTAKDGIYTIEVEAAQELRIRASAKDSHQNKRTITHTVEIIDTNDTKQIRVVDANTSIPNSHYQGNEITLATVKFEDDYIEFVSFDINVTVVKNNQKVTLDAYNAVTQIEGDQNDEYRTLTISDAKVLASFAGDYYVTFMAKDLKGNVAVFGYNFNIGAYDEQTEIQFASLPSALNGGKLELGQTLKLPQATIVAPEDATKSYVVKVVSGLTGYVINNFEFKPTKVGIYEIEYYGTVSQTVVGEPDPVITNPTKRYTVEVVDTTAPVIGEVYFEKAVELNYVLTIPHFTAFDHSEIDAENSKIVISSKSYSNTIYYGDLDVNRQITLTRNEEYKITFTAKDIWGNTSTKEYKIQVGDTEKPVIHVDEQDKDFVPSSMNVGDKLTLDLSKISITDNKDEDLTTQDLEIKLTKDGETIENIYGDSKTNYQFELKDAGTYTLTITVTDAAGNTSEAFTRTITVTAKANNGVEATEVVGVVLIVVSSLILAGAIAYFIISKRKADQYKA